MVKAVLLDVAGVLYDGERAVPGAVDAVARLRETGLPLRFLTNSTRSPRRVLLSRLGRLGIRVAPDELFTPAKAATAILAQRGLVPHLLVHPDLLEDFEGGVTDGAETAVVVGDAGRDFTYDRLNAAFRVLTGGAAFYALAANRNFRDADGELSMDAGAFVAALEYASGRQAEVLGKPAQGFFNAALEDMGVAAPEAAMIGDDAEADVAGALSAGIGRAVLVRTGKYRPGDEQRFSPRPSDVARDVGHAVDILLS
ncbi:TIGR01458 family HAD-type hydrolase [Roseovarius salis]|uniref:TIGR01458 family HAD-type hydrolase n=1 Tax=Roseovarius salis TaxID=3376063 RepID=UPI0037CBEFBF